MKKTLLRMMYSAVLAAVIGFGCGGDDGQPKNLNVGDLLDAITGGGQRYTLTVNVTPGEGGGVSRSPNNTSYKPGEQVTVTAEATGNWIFAGWSGASNDTTATVTVIMNNDLTLNANFVRGATYTLAVNLEPSGGGNVTREPNRTVYGVGERVTVTATNMDGYTFTGWSGDANGADPSVTVTMNRDLELTASFKQNTYSLTTGANTAQGGTVSRNPDMAVYTFGEQITVTAEAANGYSFTGWSGDATGTANPVIITMDGKKTLTAIFEQQKYTLAVSASPAGYGSVLRNPNKETYAYGEQVTVTATPAPANGSLFYAFNGWTGALESNSPEVTITMDGNKELLATFQQKTKPSYTLTTIANPPVGTISRNPDKPTYEEGETVTVTAAAVDGYTFTGWSGDTTGTTSVVTITINGNKTLTAHYTSIGYILTINKNPAAGGQTSQTPYKDLYGYGDMVTVSATANPGYEFTGWSDGSTSTSANVVVTMNSDQKLTANFKLATYTLNTDPIGGGNVKRNPSKDAYNYNEQVEVTAEEEYCYTFTNWSGDATGTTNPLMITMDKSKTVKANFQPSQYTLTTEVLPLGGGTVSRSPNQTSYACGATVTVTATAAVGYTFKEWIGAAAGTANPMTITMNANYTLTAVFQPIPYTLTTNVQGSGSITRSSSNDTYVYGEQVSVTAAAASCYRFTGWSDAATGTTNPITLTMNGSKTLTANFQQIPYTLTTNISPSGGGTVSPSGQTSHTCGTSVIVTATAASCYTFTGWTGDTSGTTNPLPVTLDKNKTITANFQQTPYTLTINVAPPPQQGGGSVSRNPNKAIYTCGEKVTLTATAQSGYPFTGWSGDTTSTANPIIITMDKNKTMTANFQQNQYTLTTNVSPAGGGSVSPAGQTIHPHGTQAFVTAAAEPNCHTFGWWSGDATGTANPIYITMNMPKTVTANFNTNEYILSTSVSPSSNYGNVSRSPYQTYYQCGTGVTLTATPASADHMFDSWIGAPSGVNASSNPISFAVNSSVALTAKFKVKKSDPPLLFNTTSSYLFNKGFPATVEVFAFGAGGGGAGGNRNKEVATWHSITGGAGGGGAAKYAKFNITSATTFSVTVGKGGGGGAQGASDGLAAGWNYGSSGTSGNPSTVTGGGVTITASGGGGGTGGCGKGCPAAPGGPGGSTASVSGSATGLSYGPTVPGTQGNNGGYDMCGNNGGLGAKIDDDRVKNILAGSGGAGGCNAAGANGGDGKVIMIFTWWE